MKILSLDGGGIRGVFTARVLERLEEACPGFLGEVELVAGTSTGGILALAIAKGLPPAQLVALYRDNGPRIFGARDFLDRITHLDELGRANFSNEVLREVLARELGVDTLLGDLRKRVLVSSFQLDNGAMARPRHWKPKFFHNFDGQGNDRSRSAVAVALRTSAAPTYFPTYGAYVDGGVVANNPSACALAKAAKEAGSIEKVSLLSVGTGFNPHFVEGGDHDWGYRQWLQGGRLLSMLIDGMVGVPDYLCSNLLGDRYRRIDAALPEVVDLADTSKVDVLLRAADALNLDGAVGWIKSQWLGGQPCTPPTPTA